MYNYTFFSIDDVLLLGTIKSSKNLKFSKYFQVETGVKSPTPVPVGFSFFSLANVDLKDLIFVLTSDSTTWTGG